MQVFCKYEAGRSHNSYGHRSGIAYEAEVYRRVLGLLEPSRLRTPIFHGAYKDTTTGDTWLVLEYVHKSTRPDERLAYEQSKGDPMRGGRKLGVAAHWIGQFHAANEERVSSADLSFLNVYDAKYYLGWAERTLFLAADLRDRYPWLATVCRGYEQIVDLLLEPPVTIIHGEYYRHNLLQVYGTVYPVDWESAAIGAGEVDLASLTDQWPLEIAQYAEGEYRRARWPASPPASFEQRLDAARVYLQLRWLGEDLHWTLDETRQWRFEHLRIASERLGLI
jgi:aminoglycoside phosphotransferase (APT) family kinase protein